MNYTYAWGNADQTTLRREDTEGNVAFVPTDSANRDYAEFLNYGGVADDYVAPPVPPPLTTEEKLAALGFTVEELQQVLNQP